MTENRLDFETERREQTASWFRARPHSALIERTTGAAYTVTLEDGSGAHRCVYGQDKDGEYVGLCDCLGFEYRSEGGVCAHLCTLRKADFIGLEDVNGERISALPRDELEDSRLETDGGHVVDAIAAGSDGQTFGRPEGRL